MTQKENKIERRGGFYWFPDKPKIPYVSVTNVLKIIDKPGIIYWFGNEIYWAMVEDPELGEKEAMAKPWESSGKAKDRGTTVHTIVEAWKNIGDVKGLESRFHGYAKAFDNWRTDYDIEPLEHERVIRSEKYKYGGRLDLKAKKDDKTILVDIKTNKDARIYDEVQLQLSAYKQGVEEDGEKIDELWALALGDDGNYSFKQQEYDLESFLHAKALWVWKNKTKCKKVNYKGGVTK